MFTYNFEDSRISWNYCACDVCNIDCLLMDIKDDNKDFDIPSGHNVTWIFDADNDCNSYYANDLFNNSDNDYYCYYLKIALLRFSDTDYFILTQKSPGTSWRNDLKKILAMPQ